MKSTYFSFCPNLPPHIRKDGWFCTKIPLLQAYAIEYSDYYINGLLEKIEGEDYRIEINSGEIVYTDRNYFLGDQHRLVIHYHGIRDYSYLFPKVENDKLRERLGIFYEEAERCFDNSSWLSYSLMCAAVFEGLLYSHYDKNISYLQLIKKAKNDGLLDDNSINIVESARKMRNLVHANKFSDHYIKREQAYDLRTTMDQLLKSFSGEIETYFIQYPDIS